VPVVSRVKESLVCIEWTILINLFFLSSSKVCWERKPSASVLSTMIAHHLATSMLVTMLLACSAPATTADLPVGHQNNGIDRNKRHRQLQIVCGFNLITCQIRLGSLPPCSPSDNTSNSITSIVTGFLQNIVNQIFFGNGGKHGKNKRRRQQQRSQSRNENPPLLLRQDRGGKLPEDDRNLLAFGQTCQDSLKSCEDDIRTRESSKCGNTSGGNSKHNDKNPNTQVPKRRSSNATTMPRSPAPSARPSATPSSRAPTV
jgi:hypothetical protein